MKGSTALLIVGGIGVTAYLLIRKQLQSEQASAEDKWQSIFDQAQGKPSDEQIQAAIAAAGDYTGAELPHPVPVEPQGEQVVPIAIDYNGQITPVIDDPTSDQGVPINYIPAAQPLVISDPLNSSNNNYGISFDYFSTNPVTIAPIIPTVQPVPVAQPLPFVPQTIVKGDVVQSQPIIRHAFDSGASQIYDPYNEGGYIERNTFQDQAII